MLSAKEEKLYDKLVDIAYVQGKRLSFWQRISIKRLTEERYKEFDKSDAPLWKL
ncbi:hypothetical protein [Clostridium psychrophilum]|uniref:hypothetical protein n=1 Tax=Clostridium psychrophilum TaxID=132926 RepID=UPI001C0B9B49|nr:hypothetical protein [Clostridium psychrophilum]MBU3180182.1 hypothetical protein [Clostridium psychrophilum]